MSLMDKLKSNSKIKETMALENSVVFETKDFISTEYPMINLALSGDIRGGLTSGLTMIAGPSKHFKCVTYDTVLEIFTEDEDVINHFGMIR